MDFEDIVESKFFYYFIQEYIELKHYEWFENNRLIYAFCKTTEERLQATKDEIIRIGNKIREASAGADLQSASFSMGFVILARNRLKCRNRI